MKSATKIFLCHAAAVAMDPIVTSFRANWPQARLANLLEDAWMPDLAADGRLTLLLEDNGPGIDPALRDVIFEPLASTKEHGLGIGLAVCRSIAEAHGGTLSLETSGSGGARFVLSLPHKK